MAKLTDRLIHAWNAFNGRDPTFSYNIGSGSAYNPIRNYFMFGGGDKTIVNMIINKISVDCSSFAIEHARLDSDGNYSDIIDSHLNEVLNISANIDQTGRLFIQDAVTSMCDEGVVALVPTEYDDDVSAIPEDARAYDILSMRTGKIIEWFPKHVLIELYDENNGQKKQMLFSKSFVAIVENPFYDIMNRPNSTLQRLVRTLNNLDVLDAQNSSGKLDLIIQLPYVVKNEVRKQQAETRRKMIEQQLVGSKYGIAYTDGTERITQLNRPVENNLWVQAKELTEQLFNQMGLSMSVFDGTADEATMLNYYNRTIEPILKAIADEMNRKFFTKTARSQGQSIVFFMQPFKTVPSGQMADIADKFTRNEILTPNEVRALIGFKPNKEKKSDELLNRNINHDEEISKEEGEAVDEENQNDEPS